MKRTILLLLSTCTLLVLMIPISASSNNPVESPLPTFTPTSFYYFPLMVKNWPRMPEKVIIVIWDGTQRAHLLEMLDHGELPNLENFISEDAVLLFPYIDSATCEPGSGDGYRTETCPANCAIATGLGYPGMANWSWMKPQPIPDGRTLWEWFKKRGYVTGIACSIDRQFWPHVPLSNAKPDIDYWQVGWPDSSVTDMSIEFIREYASSRFFLWVHYREPDYAGHYHGENHVEYSQALVRLDGELGTLLTELGAQGIEDRTVVVITTDHGFVEGGFGHGVCNSDTKDLFLAASRRPPGFSGCVEAQTDIAPCIKGVMFTPY
ncbi:MAG: alkaline phosphatase family protein [Anaerolineae bacterium]